jgi:hypothetical protein
MLARVNLFNIRLHQAFNALQRSGVDYRGSNTGVYVGCGRPSIHLDLFRRTYILTCIS